MSEFRQTPPPEGDPGAPPPPDWDAFWSARANGDPARPVPDLSALVALFEALRAIVPRELSDQLGALLREALLTLRALIDWYLERLDAPPAETRIEEIPID